MNEDVNDVVPVMGSVPAWRREKLRRAQLQDQAKKVVESLIEAGPEDFETFVLEVQRYWQDWDGRTAPASPEERESLALYWREHGDAYSAAFQVRQVAPAAGQMRRMVQGEE